MSHNAVFHDPPRSTVHPTPTQPPPISAQHIAQTPKETILPILDDVGDGEMDGFDPATLANLAALSRITGDGDEGEDEGLNDFEGLLPTTGEQVQALVDGLRREQARERDTRAEERSEEKKEDEEDRLRSKTEGREEGLEINGDGEGRDGSGEDERSDDGQVARGEDGEYRDPRYIFEDGKMKRKRQRTVL
jgi:hypothetical protein